MSGDDAQRRLLVVIHTMDPRGGKVGGIETHVRLLIARAPRDFEVLLVGVDGRGDLKTGQPLKLRWQGRPFTFLPVLRHDEQAMQEAARSITSSVTFRFLKGLLRHLPALRRLTRGRPASADVQRFEFAVVPKLLGLPLLLQVHGEGEKGDRMDSLISRHWGIYEASERIATMLADRIICVTPARVAKMARKYPRAAARMEFMSVSVDTDIFRPATFDVADGIMRVIFAGRLDAFKDPPLMFSALAALKERLQGALEFHYVGNSDPRKFVEFDAIADITTRHGILAQDEIATLVRRMHAGIITSYFEGLPCYLMEMIASGRPVGAIDLPQFSIRLPGYAPLVEPGESGFLLPRAEEDRQGMATCFARHFAALWEDIRAARLDPTRIAARATPYAVNTQLPRLFERHRQLQDGAPMPRNNVLASVAPS